MKRPLLAVLVSTAALSSGVGGSEERSTASAASSSPGAKVAAFKRCGRIPAEPRGSFVVKKKGGVTCRGARKLMRLFLNEKQGRKHGGPSNAETYYTLYGWRCGHGAGGGGCQRNGGRDRTLAAWSPRTAAAACPNYIHLGGRAYIFYRQRVRCVVARRRVRRLYATGGRRGRPRGFICESGSNWETGGGCHTPGYRRGFGWHPAD